MKHFINLKDISSKDLRKIIVDAKNRKRLRKKLSTLEVDKGSPLKGKILIQMFEKPSSRTRISFYLAIKQLGGGTLTLRSNELHLGQGGESITDTAKVLSTYGDGFMLRTDSEKKMEDFKKYLSIPIINGLSPLSHPTQVLSDIFTVEEIKKKPISKLNICWIGDSNNVLNSLIAASVKFSFKLSIGCPKKFEPGTEVKKWVKKNNKKIYIYNDPKKAVEIIQKSSGRNYATEITLPDNILSGKMVQGFSTGLMKKDAGVATKIADSNNVEIPLGKLSQELLKNTIDEFGENADMSNVALTYEKLTGAKIRP